MPTATFYNLPPEKQDRLLKAARLELARVPYSEVSINQIIQEAGISRGSFYNYFSNKADLVFFVLEDFLCLLTTEALHLLKASLGDVFAMFIHVYDFVQDYVQKHDIEQYFLNVLSSLNTDERSELNRLVFHYIEEHLGDGFFRLVQWDKYKVSTKEDMADCTILLFLITRESCLELFRGKEKGYVRKRFIRRLEILKHGVFK